MVKRKKLLFIGVIYCSSKGVKTRKSEKFRFTTQRSRKENNSKKKRMELVF